MASISKVEVGEQTWLDLGKQRAKLYKTLKAGELEPQVREAVFKLISLGISTASSGFLGEGGEMGELSPWPSHSIDGLLGLTPKEIQAITTDDTKVLLMDNFVPGYQAIVVKGDNDLSIVKDRFDKVASILGNMRQSLSAATKLPHRGKDPEAIKIAEKYGLLFDGMMKGYYELYYEFTTSEKYPAKYRGITFLVDNLNKVEARLKEKLTEFSQTKDFLPCNVIRTDKRWDSMVRHLGYEPVTFEKAPAGNISTDIQLIRESQERLAKVEVLPASKLSKQQKTHLELSRAIAANLALPPVRAIEAALIPPASDRVRTAGLYSQSLQEIYISSEQLESGRSTVDTTAHELSHHSSKAEDGEPEHKNAMRKVAAVIIDLTDRGQFDDILRKSEFQW